VPRRKSPDPRDRTAAARFTESEFAAIERARGATDRSVWLRNVALKAAGLPADPEPASIGPYRFQLIADERMPPGSMALVSHDADGNPSVARIDGVGTQAEPSEDKGPCLHRVKPGSFCRSCNRLIG
jgi:hypothetical protein